jgi:hypothetical protein
LVLIAIGRQGSGLPAQPPLQRHSTEGFDGRSANSKAPSRLAAFQLTQSAAPAAPVALPISKGIYKDLMESKEIC